MLKNIIEYIFSNDICNSGKLIPEFFSMRRVPKANFSTGGNSVAQ